MKKILIMTLCLAFTTAGMAQAHRATIHQRQMTQQHRIAQGINSGTLTPGEAAHLENQQARIQSNKRMARADGHISPREHAQISREQNRANQQIYALKHNNRVAH